MSSSLVLCYYDKRFGLTDKIVFNLTSMYIIILYHSFYRDVNLRDLVYLFQQCFYQIFFLYLAYDLTLLNNKASPLPPAIPMSACLASRDR